MYVLKHSFLCEWMYIWKKETLYLISFDHMFGKYLGLWKWDIRIPWHGQWRKTCKNVRLVSNLVIFSRFVITKPIITCFNFKDYYIRSKIEVWYIFVRKKPYVDGLILMLALCFPLNPCRSSKRKKSQMGTWACVPEYWSRIPFVPPLRIFHNINSHIYFVL